MKAQLIFENRIVTDSYDNVVAPYIYIKMPEEVWDWSTRNFKPEFIEWLMTRPEIEIPYGKTFTHPIADL